MRETPPIVVAAVVPFQDGAGDELLLLPGNGSYSLPMDAPRRSERVLDAAVRIVREMAGLRVTAQRLLYVVETVDARTMFGVLCQATIDGVEESDLQGEVVSLSRLERDFQPVALLEILMEDLRSGFVRPVAHVLESTGTDGWSIQVTW